VRSAQPLLVIEAMKMEQSSFRPVSGSSTRSRLNRKDNLPRKRTAVHLAGDGLHDASEVPEDFDLDAIRATWQRPSHDAPNGLMRAVPEAVARRRKTGQRNHAGNHRRSMPIREFIEYGGLALAGPASATHDEVLRE